MRDTKTITDLVDAAENTANTDMIESEDIIKNHRRVMKRDDAERQHDTFFTSSGGTDSAE
jgi:hypothetical protein